MGAGNCGLCSGTSSLGESMGIENGVVANQRMRLAVGRYGMSDIHYIKQSRQINNDTQL
jgi:hypothetical protein